MQIKKVLYPTDFSRCANQALSRALQLAKQYDAELHMLHAMVLHQDDPHNPAHHIPNIEEINARLEQIAAEQMESVVKAYQADTLDIQKVQKRGLTPSEVILEYAAENDIDLIVMGTHGRRGARHFILGSVAEKVVRLAKCSVLTIREMEDPERIGPIKQILVPVDFSKFSETALSCAKELAQPSKAKLQLLHVVEETVHPAFYVTGKTSIFEFIPDIKAKSEEAMKKLLVETPGPKVDADFQVIEGRAARDISDFAEANDSDLIVISTHGLTGLEHFLLGSVTEKVVRTAPCPVFTVKSFGKS